MSGPLVPAAFLPRSTQAIRYDLSASDSETLSLAALMRLADAEDRRNYQMLNLSYAEPRGAPWLRAAIAARHASLDADDVLCCAGAQEAVTCVMRALLAPGSHAVVVLPIYRPSEQAVTELCATTGVPLDEVGWRLDIDRVAAALRPETRLVLANFPNSPTGASLDPDTLAALVGLCRRHGLWLVIDEIYRQTDCGSGALVSTAADLYERGVSINGLSKGFGLPGLRVGWVAARDRGLIERTLAAKSMLSSCVASISEVLALVALKAERQIVEHTRQVGRRNQRRLQALIDRVPEVFGTEPITNLAFAFPRCLDRSGTDVFVATLAREAGLLLLPGSVWQSPLCRTPTDRVRIGLGHVSCGAALDALEAYLVGRERQGGLIRFTSGGRRHRRT